MFNDIKNRFATFDIEKKGSDLFKVKVDKNRVFELIEYIDKNYNYSILSAITCSDWIEEDIFAITYILTKIDRKSSFMVQTEIGRREPKIDTISNTYKQAQIMERDLHEMYGIEFIGNVNLKELSLENWKEIPPLRREFDTLKFVNENFSFRDGRDDGVDAKAEAKRLRALKKAKKAKADGK